MSPQAVKFLQRLVTDARTECRLGEVARTVSTTEGIGTIKGSRVMFTAEDHASAAHMLRARGYEVTAPAAPFTRSEAPAGGSEKTGALRVSHDLVALVPLAIPGIRMPPDGFMSLRAEAALQMPYEVLIVCENLEPMLNLGRYGWLSGFVKGRPALVLFRGAPGLYRTDVATELVRRDHRPTLAFFDFDPKGLSMAASLPRREALCLPGAAELEAAARATRRVDLFFNSFATSRGHLDRLAQASDIGVAWERMQSLELGLNQEQFPG
ncbi:hypothetical protein [Acidovorax sp.]|uniref:DUF7281 domain-containing protein n=1 Tax=Acidovorax sp. TaxID=1872122 RepID=UPI00391FABD9